MDRRQEGITMRHRRTTPRKPTARSKRAALARKIRTEMRG